MAKKTYPAGTKVWVLCFNYSKKLGEAPAVVVGKTGKGKLIFRRWNPRLKRFIQYTAWPWHITRRRRD